MSFVPINDGFEQIAGFYRGEPSRKIIWNTTASPERISGLPGHITTAADLRRDLGCLVPRARACKERHDDTVRYCRSADHDLCREEWITPVGRLQGLGMATHPVEYPVKTSEDCRILQYVYEHLIIEESSGTDDPCHGIVIGTSPVQELLQYKIGIENFYYFLEDFPAVMEGLMAAMQRKQLEKAAVACRWNAMNLGLVENTSSSLISPAYYEQFSLPQVKAVVDLAHQHGKKADVHMCGRLRALLPLLKKTGMDMIHSVAPPPTGDTPFRLMYEEFGPGFPIVGRFGSLRWVGMDKSKIRSNLEEVLGRDIVRQHPIMLWATTDECRVEYRNLKVLQEVFETYLD